MKRATSLFLVALCLLVTSCDAFRSVTSNSVVSQGAPYELIVVCNQPEWEGELGDTLRAVLTAPIPYIASTEPYFDVLRITHSSYNNLILRHRNILRTVISPEVEQPAIAVEYDIYATPQIILTLQAPTADEAAIYLGQHRESVMQVLEGAERDRAIAYGDKFSLEILDKIVMEEFDVEINIPQGYTLRQQSEDMLWFSYEFPTASQGLVLYSYPAEGIASLEPQALVKARNKFVSRIPGPSDGSYMTTFVDYEPDFRAFRLEGRLWCEMRGLWDVAGDFMGGPFVSYSTIDERTNRVLTLDCYVYSPKLGKRNFLRALEHILYSIQFPTE